MNGIRDAETANLPWTVLFTLVLSGLMALLHAEFPFTYITQPAGVLDCSHLVLPVRRFASLTSVITRDVFDRDP